MKPSTSAAGLCGALLAAGLTVLLLATGGSTLRARAAARSDAVHLAPFEHAVGYRVLSFEHAGWGGGPRRVDVAVWYPTDAAPAPFTYVHGRRAVASQLAVDAPVLAGAHPLVLYSHAATGSGHSMAFLAERLAGRGYVVAAPDYPDAHFAARIRGEIDGSPAELQRQVDWIRDLQARQLNTGGRTYRRERLAYRPQVASRTIDLLLGASADPASPFHGRVDGERVAAVGHSFGAWTSLLVAGADPLFADPRVRAVVAYTPPCNERVFEEGELERIAVPSLVMVGAREAGNGRDCDPAWLYGRLAPPKLWLAIEDADQLVFSGGLRGDFGTCQEYVLRDPRRAAVVVHTMAFLDWVLAGDAQGRRRLELSTASVGARRVDWGD